MYPTPAQEAAMDDHCRHARQIWNVALEQANCHRPHWRSTPNHLERNRQLTEARASFDWLRAGSQTVQQQALRDFDEAMRNWWGGSHRHPTWRKAGVNEGFRIVGPQAKRVEQLNRKWSQVLIPKVGWVRFRRSRSLTDFKSYRVTLDRAGRWHIAFAVIPPKIDGPGDGSVIGVDRGVVVSVALSNGELIDAPDPTDMRRQARKLSAAKRGSTRREQARVRVARLKARDADRRKDFVEKATTDLASRFDVVKIEKLSVKNMTRSAKGTVEKPGRNVAQKRGLNRSILEQNWGMIQRRLRDKIGDRLVLVPAAYTSQMCSTCGEVDANSRKSQAKFVCTTCGMVEHADVNAAINIAAGHAVTGRGDIPKAAGNRGALSANRQPQLLLRV